MFILGYAVILTAVFAFVSGFRLLSDPTKTTHLLVEERSGQRYESFQGHDGSDAARTETEESAEHPEAAEPPGGQELGFQVEPHVHQQEGAAESHHIVGRQAANHEDELLVPGRLWTTQQGQGTGVGAEAEQIDARDEKLVEWWHVALVLVDGSQADRIIRSEEEEPVRGGICKWRWVRRIHFRQSIPGKGKE